MRLLTRERKINATLFVTVRRHFGLVGRELRETLAHFNPVAIHANFGKSGAYALPLARALNIPLIVTYHGGDATKTSNTKDSRLRVYNRRRQALWDEAALLLPVSDFIRRELLAKGAPDEKMVVQYNGVDPEKFTPGEKENVLLFAGRWMEKKGIETLIRALTKIDPDILKNWRIRLLGDGELKPKLLPLLEAAGVKAELAVHLACEHVVDSLGEYPHLDDVRLIDELRHTVS